MEKRESPASAACSPEEGGLSRGWYSGRIKGKKAEKHRDVFLGFFRDETALFCMAGNFSVEKITALH
jgi:hypothetical protein